MSDYCKGCAYNPKLKTGAKACPFNYLYWDFLLRNREKLAGNVRLAMPYRSLHNMDAARLAQIREDAQRFLSSLDA
jgi:deoxyribodipyrimidine photolyase-related protein